MSYIRFKSEIEGYLLTPENIDFVAKWCKGSIKGMAYPVSERVIDIWTDDHEIRAIMGDYVVKETFSDSTVVFEAMSEEKFKRIFTLRI